MVINFRHSGGFVGTLVKLYQLLRGVKHWQLCHVELLSSQGVLSYSVGGIQLSGEYQTELGVTVAVERGDEKRILMRARMWYDMHGDLGPCNLVRGRNCTTFVTHCLELPPVYLPGLLYERLSTDPDYGWKVNTTNYYSAATTQGDTFERN
jgi:hypothetical protein